VKITLKWPAMTGLAFALVLTSATAAVADPSVIADRNGNTTSVARTIDGRAVTDEATAKEVAAYWTPERMAAAINLDFVKPEAIEDAVHAAPKPDGPAGTVAPAAPSIAIDRAGIQLNESLAVGKVYFSTPWGGSSCSASTVASGKRRLVMTAGHCVNSGRGGVWYSNWVFVPQYRSGSQPWGSFVAYQLTSRTAWVNSGSYSEDMGIAIMHNGGWWGLKVVDTVGGHGMRWNWGYGPFMTALGYPSNLGGGEIQWYCQSGTWWAHDEVIRMWCPMTYGSSGGPWLQEYNDQTGYGYINSVVSHGDNPGNGQFDGPYFDNDIKSLYDFAEGLSPA
jgi:V8-like Glu-specific endopeptidase